MAESWEDLPDVPSEDWEKLPDVVAPPPAGKVPSPTGWRTPEKANDLVDKGVAMDERKMPAMWGALASGAHGAANAMEGPVNGALAVLGAEPMTEKGPRSWDDLLKVYRDKRDEVEGAQKPNLRDFPLAPAVGSILTTPGSAPTVLGRLAMGAGQGAVYGIGSSKGDLTKGETEQVGMDALKGGAIGLGAAGVGEALQVPGRALAKRAQNISDATHAAQLAAEQEARAGAVASTRGALGGETSAGSNQLKMLRDALTNPNVEPELKRAAEEFLASPEGKTLLNQVLRSNLGRAEGQVPRIANAQSAMTDAIAKNEPSLIRQAAEAAAEAKLNDPSGVTGRLGELARRNLPPMIGGALAGPAGAAAGGLAAGAMGKPGTIVSNMMKSPSMFRPLTSAAGVGIGAGQTMSRAGEPLAEWLKLLRDGQDEGTE